VGRSTTQEFEGFWRSLQYYLGDLSYFDPTIQKAYEEVLIQIDRAIGGIEMTCSFAFAVKD
jgi:hypothetical protein